MVLRRTLSRPGQARRLPHRPGGARERHHQGAGEYLGADPKLQVLQDFPKIVAFFGYPGPYTPQIQEVALQFVLPDIFTRVARGQSVDDSVKWGSGEYRRIFSKHKKA